MKETEEKDVFRDTPVRYLGYANEVGESFRALVSKTVVNSTYVIAFSYVLADATSKSKQPVAASFSDRLTLFSDALLWQSFASVIVPGLTINRICATCGYFLRKTLTSTSPIVRKWICTFIGLSAIPLIIHPIDKYAALAVVFMVVLLLMGVPFVGDTVAIILIAFSL